MHIKYNKAESTKLFNKYGLTDETICPYCGCINRDDCCLNLDKGILKCEHCDKKFYYKKITKYLTKKKG